MHEDLICVVNRNADCAELARKLNAISAKRRKKRRWFQRKAVK